MILFSKCCGSGSEIRCLLYLWIRDPVWVKSKDPGSGCGMNNPDQIFESFETIFWLKYLNCLMRIQNQGWKKVGSEIRDGENSDTISGINIPDPLYCISYHSNVSGWSL
jgi:hypothetical protein